MRWSSEDESELLRWYETCGADIPSLLNKGYTKSQIYSKAFRIGITQKQESKKRCDLTEQLLLDMYHDECMTVEQIAEETGWCEQTVYKYMHEYNVPLTGKKRYTECDECGYRIKVDRQAIVGDEEVLCHGCELIKNLGLTR